MEFSYKILCTINHDVLVIIIGNHYTCAIMINHDVIWVEFGYKYGKIVNIMIINDGLFVNSSFAILRVCKE